MLISQFSGINPKSTDGDMPGGFSAMSPGFGRGPCTFNKHGVLFTAAVSRFLFAQPPGSAGGFRVPAGGTATCPEAADLRADVHRKRVITGFEEPQHLIKAFYYI